MKIIFICLVFTISALAFDEGIIEIRYRDEIRERYSTLEYEVVRKKIVKKDNSPTDYSTKKFRLKSNSISIYMGRGPTHISHSDNEEGTRTFYLDQSNLYGIALSQRLNESFHLEMIGLSNETIMSGFKFEFGSP